MGWKGAIRSVNAAIRAAERDSKRRHRELERRHKEYAKMLELERDAYEVEVYENYIDRLISLHKECSAPVDWKRIAMALPPEEPKPSHSLEDQAQQEWIEYKPGFVDKLLKRGEAKKAQLLERIELAKREDERRHQEELRRYEEKLIDWQDSKAFAERVLAREAEAYMEAVKELNGFNELGEIGSSVTLEMDSGKPVEALLHVHGEKVIPKEQKSLLQSGKLSKKQMPQGKYYELYQDSVCSAVLRVARELFAMLPIDMVIVTAMDELLNTQTGHLEEQPIISIAIPRKTLEGLNMEMIDPSDSMQRFVHNMDFKKTKGFQAVERVKPSDLQLMS
jgi:hypothetical protein